MEIYPKRERVCREGKVHSFLSLCRILIAKNSRILRQNAWKVKEGGEKFSFLEGKQFSRREMREPRNVLMEMDLRGEKHGNGMNEFQRLTVMPCGKVIQML